MMMPNRASFRIGGGGNKDRGLTKIHRGVTQAYIKEMLSSQKNTPSRTVSEAEEELMMNRIFNADYRNYRERK